MRALPNSMIAMVLYPEDPALNFAALVGEIDRHLTRHGGGHALSWDCDDVASFDMAGLRLLLARPDPAPPGFASALLLGAGPRPGGGASPLHAEIPRLCLRLVEGALHRHPSDTVLWQEDDAALDADLADRLAASLPDRDAIEQILHAAAQPPAPEPPPGHPANDRPDLPGPDQEVLHRLRRALYPQSAAPPAPSPQLRLAAHALDCTLMMVAMPVGAAMMTYNLMRGGDAALSARAMALTGIGVALLQGGLGLPLT